MVEDEWVKYSVPLIAGEWLQKKTIACVRSSRRLAAWQIHMEYIPDSQTKFQVRLVLPQGAEDRRGTSCLMQESEACPTGETAILSVMYQRPEKAAASHLSGLSFSIFLT